MNAAPSFYAVRVAIAAIVFCTLVLCAAQVRAEPKVIQVSGRAEIRAHAAANWERLRAKTALPAGASVRVRDKGSVTLQDDSAQTTITIRGNSRLGYEGTAKPAKDAPRPEAQKPVPHYSLPHGDADIRVVPGRTIDVQTPLILTSVRGTRYLVAVQPDGSSSVRVSRGTVSVTDRFGTVSTVNKGQRYSLTTLQHIEMLQRLPKPPPRVDRNLFNGGGGDGDSGGGAGGGGGAGDGGGDGDD